MIKTYTAHGPGEGTSYSWEADHTFVKVAHEDSGGAYTLMEDNLKPHFELGLHMHREHAETFYILDGPIDFFIDGDWIEAAPGTTIHIPPGVPHACSAGGRANCRMLMIYQPAGFDLFLREMGQMSDADFADTSLMAALNEKYDIVPLGPMPDRP